MNVQSIDLGDELRQGVQFCLDLAPVILCRPIARQRLNRRLDGWAFKVSDYVHGELAKGLADYVQDEKPPAAAAGAQAQPTDDGQTTGARDE